MPALVSDIALGAIDRGETLRYLGHRGQGLPDELAERLGVALARCQELARPRMALRTFAVAGRGVSRTGVPELRLEGAALVLAGDDIARHLARAEAVGVLAVTLGMRLERELRRLSLSGDALGQVMLDAAATAAVEQAADAAEAELVAQATERGCGATGRFSPGYGDLPLSCQGALLASVDASRRLGITLTEGDLLVPTKSVTAVMGVGPKVGRAHRPGCDACGLRGSCRVREAGRTCHR